MNPPTMKYLSIRGIVLTFFLFLMILPTMAFSEEEYAFERLWPTPQHPWYDSRPAHVAVDNSNNILVANDGFIQKFTSNGHFISSFGRFGSAPDEFISPRCVAVDINGRIFVGNSYVNFADRHVTRIMIFSGSGDFIESWGSYGNEDGEFARPSGIAFDNFGNVYVSDTGNNRIQKFTSDGQFIKKWGGTGTGDGQFKSLSGIAIDQGGNIYVSDSENHRVQKFTPDGQFITKWGQEGDGEGEFNSPSGIAINNDGLIHVTDQGNHRIQVLTGNGEFVDQWGSYGNGEGDFDGPFGIKIGRNGDIYITDKTSFQKFTPTRRFLTRWEASRRNGEGFFNNPSSVDFDQYGNVYIVDRMNHFIQKFDADGVFLNQWGGYGSNTGQFNIPQDICVDGDGNTYVTDSSNNRIQKFDASGQAIHTWGSPGSGNGQFQSPVGIAIDLDGNIHVADYFNSRVQKFTPDGNFVKEWSVSYPLALTVDGENNVYVIGLDVVRKYTASGVFLLQWGARGSNEGELNGAYGISVDKYSNVYVADTFNHRIQVFTKTGQFVGKWGSRGINSEQMKEPNFVAVSPVNDKIYVADTANHRIQVFKKVSLDSKAKAIIVAGGGSYQGNNLWDVTQMNASFAYRSLNYQGFTKESIYYLSSDAGLDIDQNGEFDDVSGNATNANLQAAVTTWAADADSLVVYLVDHGGNATFRMSGTETLPASELDLWLDQLQQTLPGKVTVVYDACESGSFLLALTPPAGKERVVLTSTSPGESAYFVSQGSISFSNYFWTQIFNGLDVKSAFELSGTSLGYTTDRQHPLVDANGNGVENEAEDFSLIQNIYIGNGTIILGDAPVIGSISPEQTINNDSTAPLYADNVTDDNGVARVWATIRPPDFNQGDSNNPIQEMPFTDFMPVDGQPGRYEANYNNFNIEGTYQIAVYARDRIGNTSIPVLTTVNVNNPLRRKAIILAAGSQTDPMWPVIEKNTEHAYNVIRFQGYADDDIYFMSPVVFSTGVDVSNTVSNLQYAIEDWGALSTQDVVVYMIGNGTNGSFEVSATETVTAAQLDTWLDTLQAAIPGKATLIYDANNSGSFIQALTPPAGKQRISIASSSNSQPAYYPSDGDISFSKFFWGRVFNGTNLQDAFVHAQRAIRPYQSPVLEDSGNGVGNEKVDGLIARYYTLGAGIMLAGDDPLIDTIVSQQTIALGETATIWVDSVTTTGTIDRVWAVLTPPDYDPAGGPVTDLPEIDLTHIGDNRHEGIFTGFTGLGTYHVAVYARDAEGNLSMPKETTICYVVCTDEYEEDDSYTQARVIILNNTEDQHHNFHTAGDEDWVKFYALSGETYSINVDNLGPNCDIVLQFYDTDGTTLLDSMDTIGDPQASELIEWTCSKDGIYYAKAEQYDPAAFGENTEYDFRVYNPIGPFFGFVQGFILDASSGLPIGNAVIKTDNRLTALSSPENGYYVMIHRAGDFTLTINAPEYQSYSEAITVQEQAITDRTIYLNQDNSRLNEVIAILQVLSGSHPGGFQVNTDLGADGKVGLPEAVYLLQDIAGFR